MFRSKSALANIRCTIYLFDLKSDIYLYVKKDDADLSEKPSQPKAAARRSREEGGQHIVHKELIKLGKAGSGCEDERKVEQVTIPYQSRS